LRALGPVFRLLTEEFHNSWFIEGMLAHTARVRLFHDNHRQWTVYADVLLGNDQIFLFLVFVATSVIPRKPPRGIWQRFAVGTVNGIPP
jgi:hypothetical protein